MNEEEILHIHEMLYQYFMLLRQEDTSLRFKLATHPSTENETLVTSFWWDMNHAISHVLLALSYQIHFKTLSWHLTGTWTSDKNTDYLEKIDIGIGSLDKSDIYPKMWYKKMATQNILSSFKEFIAKYKPLIDNYFKKNPPPFETVITDEFFKKEVKLVETYRTKLKGLATESKYWNIP